MMRAKTLIRTCAEQGLPVLISDEVSFVEQQKNVFLGGFEDSVYDRQEIRLKPGRPMISRCCG